MPVHIDLNKGDEIYEFACGRSYKTRVNVEKCNAPESFWLDHIKNKNDIKFLCKNCLKHLDVQLHVLTIIGD